MWATLEENVMPPRTWFFSQFKAIERDELLSIVYAGIPHATWSTQSYELWNICVNFSQKEQNACGKKSLSKWKHLRNIEFWSFLQQYLPERGRESLITVFFCKLKWTINIFIDMTWTEKKNDLWVSFVTFFALISGIVQTLKGAANIALSALKGFRE